MLLQRCARTVATSTSVTSGARTVTASTSVTIGARTVAAAALPAIAVALTTAVTSATATATASPSTGVSAAWSSGTSTLAAAAAVAATIAAHPAGRTADRAATAAAATTATAESRLDARLDRRLPWCDGLALVLAVGVHLPRALQRIHELAGVHVMERSIQARPLGGCGFCMVGGVRYDCARREGVPHLQPRRRPDGPGDARWLSSVRRWQVEPAELR